MLGLKDSDIATIQEVLAQFPEVQSALVFGSRAKGTHRNGSDVDIALKGGALSYQTVIQIASILNEETLMPYQFDIIDYNDIQNTNLIEHIDRVGQVIYDKEAQAVERGR
ncbi:MAG TPA: nucleotidyltransferase domain-containing protein [Saprospiraceae bacterium]|nr:nucleotidyltransferase domain-containing protein [Saprospiraceae bacterium]HMP15329.1 nucleotidyltransferase domain-containing protein [Saprospiraceae bacterium]